ncbi:hypothetical protein NXF25_019758 [Crotalus adamanteus]|uniref:Uncharacterized protein n=1 Tax=Crotalus adamanteus TaxID=8729 RepID=A0AAW1B390_CROAD
MQSMQHSTEFCCSGTNPLSWEITSEKIKTAEQRKPKKQFW